MPSPLDLVGRSRSRPVLMLLYARVLLDVREGGEGGGFLILEVSSYFLISHFGRD